jgi:hypothetical protein
MCRSTSLWRSCLAGILTVVVALPLLGGCSGTSTTKTSKKTDNSGSNGDTSKKADDPGAHGDEVR